MQSMRTSLVGLTALLCLSSTALLAFSAPLTDYSAVQADIRALFINSQDFWPADFGHYGPFFIRLAWHCTGSYRISDGRGGCDGARQRFDPERSWADNTNLDKARHLLQPIKEKYGDALSWGDLIVLTGTTAIADMGGPVLGFCGGRTDDMDGTASIKLGPTAEQAALLPCPVDGNCSSPLGPSTLGLIYVNPEGFMGVPDPVKSFPMVRDTFKRMAMNDSETVALIGGGHAFGKTHGACPLGPGPAPNMQPTNPWPGLCGAGAAMGKGVNAFTSGFEGPWTTTPTKWSNQYFQNLLNFNWSVHVGPGGHNQWGSNLTATMMLTSDVSLLQDPNYLSIVQEFGTNLSSLNNAFSHAWYKLVSRDMGPVTRCVGNMVPPPQIFQYPLPAAPSVLADENAVRDLIKSALASNPAMLPLLAHLTFQCASTFRQTDYLGGCNGARIRFAPQNTWSVNAGTDAIIQFLKTNVMDKYTSAGALSYADMIVLAGQVAVESATSKSLKFCAGRVDATEGSGSELLTPRVYNDSDILTTLLNVRDFQELSGLPANHWVVLHAHLRTDAQQQAMGYSGAWGGSTSNLTNEYFTTLLSESWQLQASTGGKNEYKAAGKNVFMTPEDVSLIYDAQYLAIVQEYAANNTMFLNDFVVAWTHLVNMDRFDGPTGNLCMENMVAAAAGVSGGMAANGITSGTVAGGVVGGIFVGLVLAGIMFVVHDKKSQRNAPEKTGLLLGQH